MAPPLAYLISCSFSTWSVPDELKKKTSVTPIFKAGDTSETNNYRPISVPPMFAKIMEKCMYNRVMAFCEQYSILSNNLYGFKIGKSCSDAIISLAKKHINLSMKRNL